VRQLLLCVLVGLFAPACETKHGCTGDAVACEKLGLEQCMIQDSCSSWGGTCSGQARALCAAQTSESGCTAQGGCYWATTCGGTARQCNSFSSSECSSHQSCYWSSYDNSCAGYVTACSSVDPLNCSLHPGCVPTGFCSGDDSCALLDVTECARRAGCAGQADCSGWVAECSSFDTAAACAQQAGCHWQ
jgi:hypothetical protein